MVRSRIELQSVLESILGSRNVYFQPPASLVMKYPAIVYELENIQTRHGDNEKYLKNKAYKITLIDRDPDSTYIDEIGNLPYTSFDRSYVSDNLNHFVFTIFTK